MTDAELIAALRDAALLEGDFTLRSGRKSRYYFDKYLFETQPRLLRGVAQRLARYVDPHIDRIAGPELGGVALATAVALETDRPFVIVRNSKKADYGTGKLIEGRLEAGERVMLVEDVVTSGGQAIEAARALATAGAEVRRVVAVLDRQEGGVEAIRAAGFACESLFTSADLGVRVD
ncbi:MAG: orotate phosphoribosyltransferase [Planctomycetota bacterium]|nr:MAG: orotate phosphoribosyltransferase [Planctomycetota bacterium]